YPRMTQPEVAAVEKNVQSRLSDHDALYEAWSKWWSANNPLGLNHFGPIEKGPVIASETEKAVASERLRQSLAGRIGHVIEPAIKPLGYDWKMGIGLVGAFAAREMFVGTMGIVYSVGGPGDETAALSSQMNSDLDATQHKVWTPLVAVSLLVWFVL